MVRFGRTTCLYVYKLVAESDDGVRNIHPDVIDTYNPCSAVDDRAFGYRASRPRPRSSGTIVDQGVDNSV